MISNSFSVMKQKGKSMVERFIKAQEMSYQSALQEIKNGKKDKSLDMVYISAAQRSGPEPDFSVLWDRRPGGSRRIYG